VTAGTGQPGLPLFIYGSLRDPEVRVRLLGGRTDLSTRPAVLHGHARKMVSVFDYPFVVPATPDSRVDGELLVGLKQADYEILDEYEDVDDGLYWRTIVTVQTPAGPERAWVYLKGPSEPRLA
jgi:gamma-glutamylcyclotransferase (GGCT)/AIG2-like uncharacterized protein YtfP